MEDGPIWALGLMSGTSMDGIDAAAVLTNGTGIQGFGPKRFLEYPAELRDLIARGQGLWPGEAPVLDEIGRAVDARHAEAALPFPTCTLIGFHGQTLAHDPTGFRTFQAGDGRVLSKACGRKIIWDFRTADVLSGGEGAPLVPVFHHACAQLLGFDRPVVFLNIGGVANVTWVDPVAPVEAPGALLAFDTGPGNALINDLMATRAGAAMDAGGALAAAGTVDAALVAAVLDDPYFSALPPKSLDRNHFSWIMDRISGHQTADAAATLTAITAATIAASIRHLPEPPERWLVAGGGRKNTTLMGMLTGHTNAPVEPVEVVSLDGDFLEAQAFAYLAVRVQKGLPTSFPGTTGCRIPVCGGRVSSP